MRRVSVVYNLDSPTVRLREMILKVEQLAQQCPCGKSLWGPATYTFCPTPPKISSPPYSQTFVYYPGNHDTCALPVHYRTLEHIRFLSIRADSIEMPQAQVIALIVILLIVFGCLAGYAIYKLRFLLRSSAAMSEDSD
ncbi:uncharacterized protein LAJ45_00314 [Morchella importuna]|uniref:uncharacterized protein n=1 Tax=Morchella importuna TaxID=1174673 RepID=UPI001E8EDD22|nr:uncharacterized protein LAJ45_00314 [Morchella importuna]KAH8155304.1 hypothetical protein LAJ45_00314 [Morchella importuna]